MKHTKEPWKVTETSVANLRSANGKYVANCGACGMHDEERQANRHRIAACVNALAGIAEPEAFVAKVREAVAAMNRANAAATDGNDRAMFDAEDEEVVALSALASMLPQENPNG